MTRVALDAKSRSWTARYYWLVMLCAGILTLLALPVLIWRAPSGIPMLLGLALWCVGVVTGTVGAAFVLRADLEQTAYRARLGDPPRPAPSPTVSWAAAVAAVAVLSPVFSAPFFPALRGPVDFAVMCLALLAGGAVGPLLIVMSRAQCHGERRAEREIEEGMHPDADLPGRAPGVRDAWDEAAPLARGWTVAVAVASVAVFVVGVGLSVGILVTVDPSKLSRQTAAVAYRAIRWGWAVGLLALAVPPVVWAVWRRAWFASEARLVASMDADALVGYLNRERRPRLSRAELIDRTYPRDVIVRVLEVLLFLAFWALPLVAAWGLWRDLRRAGENAWLTAPLYAVVLVWTAALGHAVTGTILRERRMKRRLIELP
jgi:hypothetical protein